MPARERPHPYIWPTWISGLLSGDKHCEFASWFRAHYTDYDRLPQDDASANRLSLWKADHARMVRARVAELREEHGHDNVFVEDQNRFFYKGTAATMSGCPDILAVDDDHERIYVADCKTGKERDSDFWQVATYMVMLPYIKRDEFSYEIWGEIAYRERTRYISPTEADQCRQHIFAMVKRIADDQQLEALPSESECRWCDIKDCTYRWQPEDPTGGRRAIDLEGRSGIPHRH